MSTKAFIVILCIMGLALIFMGLVWENNWIFIAGIILVIAGYLMIRRKLKESMKQKKR